MRLFIIFLFLFWINNITAQNSITEELGKLYHFGNYTETIKRAKAFLLEEPKTLDVKLILGRALTDNGDIYEAIPHLLFVQENSKNNSWQRAWANGYLGVCYYRNSNYQKAKLAFETCIKDNATKNSSAFAKKRLVNFGLTKYYSDWTIVETENFRFFFQNMKEKDKKTFIEDREGAFETIKNFFGVTLPKKIDFFVWNSAKEAKKQLHYNLGFALPEDCLIHSHKNQTKGHEITHVLSHYLVKNIKKSSFIDEGTAVNFNLSEMDNEDLVIKYAKKNKEEINLLNAWNRFRQFPQEYTYPLSGLFVNRLIEKYGIEKFLAFFKNQTYHNAKLVYGESLDYFISLFEEELNSKIKN